ncbi:MAG: FkbM family methyltransferase, partial [Pseudomonadota bacterium]|nr:FkbM family methyltransferase [Pseudomonadota bacterium]
HWARGLGSFYKDKNNLGCPELAKHAVTIEVKTATIDDIYDKYNITNKHNVVVVTDLEGHDYEILKTFNFKKYNPDIYISEIELFTRYPISHPRRQNYINEQMNPDAIFPPPGEKGWLAWVDFKKLPDDIKEHIERNNLRDKSNVHELQEYLTNLAGNGVIEFECGYPTLSLERPHELEYQQQYGLYTPEEFKKSVEIFESNDYTVLRQSGEDMVAIKTELLKNSAIIKENC